MMPEQAVERMRQISVEQEALTRELVSLYGLIFNGLDPSSEHPGSDSAAPEPGGLPNPEVAVLARELSEAKEENERLREALKEIAAFVPQRWTEGVDSAYAMRVIAGAALAYGSSPSATTEGAASGLEPGLDGHE